jgi:cytidyltransferase-like protein
MKISTLLEERRLLAVVYGGRFQPFHKGHYAVYKQLCKQFGEGAVWIATSNKTNFNPANGDVSPFTFDERAEIMTQMFGISPDKVIKCKNPAFSPSEVLEQYKAPVICVMVAGDKDVGRYKDSDSYQPYPMKGGKPVPFDNVSSTLKTASGDPATFYYVINNARDGEQSGTTIRAAFTKAGDDHDEQVAAFKKFYGSKVDDEVLDLLVSKIKMIKKPEPKEAKKS